MTDSLPSLRAEDLVAAMENAAGDALLIIGEQIAEATRADIPVGDPAVDPDPGYALRDHVEVRRYGHLVSISVEGPYAAKLHEQLQSKHPRGGMAKFLERNVAVAEKALSGALALEVSKAFANYDPKRKRKVRR